MLKFACPQCRSPIGVEAQMAGQKVRCPSCKSVMRVPVSAAEAVQHPVASGASAPTLSAGPSPPPGRYTTRSRKKGANSALVFGGIAVLCLAFLTVLIVAAINQTNRTTPQPAAAATPTPAPAINVDPSTRAGNDDTAMADDATDGDTSSGRASDPPIQSGSGKVVIAGVEFDEAGNPVNRPRSAASNRTPLTGFEPFYDQFEDTTTLTSRPSLMVRASDGPVVQKEGNLYFGVSVTHPGRQSTDPAHAKIMLEVTAAGTDWQSQEPNPALGLVVFWGDQHYEVPVEHKFKAPAVGGQPSERLQYLWSLERLQALANANSVKVMVQGQSYNLGNEHLDAMRRLVKYLKPDRAP